MKKIITTLGTALILSGCASQGTNLENLVNPELPFRAVGNEPAWQVMVNQTQIELTQGYSATNSQVFTKPKFKQQDDATYIFAGTKNAAINLKLTQKVCYDPMSGMPHPWQVEVEVDGKKLKSCGGNPANLLIGEWQVEDINQQGIIDSSHVTLNFTADGKVNGSSSCNRYFAEYKLTGESLSFSNAGSTRMACPTALMNQEQRFLKTLGNIKNFSFSPEGALILQGNKGESLRGFPVK